MIDPHRCLVAHGYSRSSSCTRPATYAAFFLTHCLGCQIGRMTGRITDSSPGCLSEGGRRGAGGGAERISAQLAARMLLADLPGQPAAGPCLYAGRAHATLGAHERA